MSDSSKTPTILVIDDDVAGDERRRKQAIRNITKVVDTLGYDSQQKERILEHVRFFAQYDERDGSQPREECAVHYLKDRKGDTEVPVLAFVDNNFEAGSYGQQHGREIIADLKNEAEKRGKYSRLSYGSVRIALLKILLMQKLSLNAYDPKAIFDLAKSPFQEKPKWDGRDATWKAYREPAKKSEDQVLIHTLRDAFETIAGRPNQKPWKDWVSQRGDKEPSVS